MSGQPWYKRNPTDFINGIVGLPLEQIGAYAVVIDLIYMRGRAIPDDMRWLSGHLNCTPKMARKLIEGLAVRGRITVSDGLISDDRATREIAILVENSAKNARNGEIGGKKRAENERKLRENNWLGQAPLKHNRIEQNREEGRESPQAREPEKTLPENLDDAVPNDLADMQKLAAECARTAGTRQADPVQFGKDIGLCRGWVADGADPPLILETIREGVAASAKPIWSLSYFDQPIRTAVAKRKALENGTPPSPRRHAAPVDELTAGALARMEARRAGAAADPTRSVGLLR